jgi:2-succinyl-6-hydroxy-2,4-cyclohexadiene-1-carboxylate synthase
VPNERRVDIGALTLAVNEAGEGGRPLLLVHGYTGNKSDFDPVIDVLAERGWHVVAPDNRGHGDSDKPGSEDDYSFTTFAADALALADALGWDQFVLLGHSMGGMIAQELVLAAPERVRGLILMDTSHTHVSIDPDLVALGAQIAREQGLETLVALQRDIEDPLATAAHLRMCATVPGYAELGERHTMMCSPAMYVAMLHQITDTHDRLDSLAAVTCPTLVIVGEQDVPFIKPSRRMAETIAGAQLKVLADAGHSPQYESPDEWFAAVLPFLDSLS